MIIRVRRSAALAALACGVAVLPLSTARAEVVTLSGDMKGTNEAPPNDSPATGRAEAKFDTATRQLSWNVTYSGLTGPAAGAHFHGPAEPGKNAGIVVPFATGASPIAGSTTLNEKQAEDLLAGRWYANIHSAKHPGGEIRGQVTRQGQ